MTQSIGGGDRLRQLHQPVALDPRLAGVAAVMGLADAPAVQHHPLAGRKARMVRAFHHPGEVDPRRQRPHPHHRRLAGQRQPVLVVHRRVFHPHGDIALHQVGVGEVDEPGLLPGVGLEQADGAETVGHGVSTNGRGCRVITTNLTELTNIEKARNEIRT